MAKFDFIYNNISLNASTAIIGGADGPTAIFIAGRIGDSVISWMVGLVVVLVLICVVRLLKKRK